MAPLTDPTLDPMSSPDRLALHRLDPGNVGDMASNPALYLPELASHRTADLTFVDLDVFDHLESVIVGGGGLLRDNDPSWWAQRWTAQLDRLSSTHRPRQLVLWGVGHLHGYRLDLELSRFTTQADLAGIRDRVDGVRWVPCASCLHPFFDDVPDPTHEVVVFSKDDFELRWGDAPRMTNSGFDVTAAMRFCASGDLVVTNSYHGWYWATLAGRRTVVVEPRSSKWANLAWPSEIVTAQGADLIDPSRSGRRHHSALDEARAANLGFAREVVAAW